MSLHDRQNMKIQPAVGSLPGLGGEARRQDCAEAKSSDHGILLMVADGHDITGQGGRTARLVVDAVVNHYRNWNGQGPRKMLVDAFGIANAALRQVVGEQQLDHPAVSLVLLHYQEGMVRIAHAGQCRAYRQRNYIIDQLTEDHTAPDRSETALPTRAVGLHAIIEVDVSDAHFVQSGETYILCTDGLYRNLSDIEIGRQAMTGDPGPACEVLVRQAAANAGAASVSAAMIKFTQPQGPKLSAEVSPSPSIEQAHGRIPWTPIPWRELSIWWKLRLVALGVLAAWFLILLVLWWGLGWGGLASAAPPAGVVAALAPLGGSIANAVLPPDREAGS